MVLQDDVLPHGLLVNRLLSTTMLRIHAVRYTVFQKDSVGYKGNTSKNEVFKS